MLLSIAAIVVGLALLVWGADRFVLGAAATARNLGVAPIIIGLTVVGFGTSAPELLISSIAAWQGNPGLAVGNALGSNIANIALILGFTAVIAPLTVASDTLKRELPVLVGAMVLALLLILDGELGRLDGLLLILALVAVMAWIVRTALRSRDDPLRQELETELPPPLAQGRATLWLLIGLAVLLFSSRILVWGAVNIAQTLGVSDLVIGLTIVAIGTSLPELAASIASALKNEHDIAVGNIIGSNLFNTLGVLGLPGLIHPLLLESAVLTRDMPVLFALTLVMYLSARGWAGHPGSISRLEGGVFLVAFAAYQATLYLTA